MEAGRPRESQSLLDQIKPPRLKDAGLEDCALSPDSIREAFFKAASSVRSHVPRCVEDPSEQEETEASSSDALMGITEGASTPSEGCAADKGLTKLPETDDGTVIGGSVEERGVESLPEGGDQPCVDGLAGLEIGGNDRGILGNSDKDGHDKDEEREG